MNSVRSKLQEVLQRVAEAEGASGRAPGQVKVLAVSKRQSIERIQEAILARHRYFGESYVKEAALRFNPELATREGIELHCIGRLQRNKVRQAVAIFDLIQAVDTFALGEEISKEGIRAGRVVPVLIQVNVSVELSKGGVHPEETARLLKQLLPLPGLNVRGLMAIGEPVDTSEPLSRRKRDFVALRSLRDELIQHLGITLPELSMGMSDDFELAIEEGATVVRIGSAIFGSRE